MNALEALILMTSEQDWKVDIQRVNSGWNASLNRWSNGFGRLVDDRHDWKHLANFTGDTAELAIIGLYESAIDAGLVAVLP